MNLKRYFEQRDANKPKPVWVYGERISGKINSIPIIGMVIREDYTDPKNVLVHLDLPITLDDELRYVVLIPSKGMKRLKEY